jgi:hypothetical protein
MLAEQLITKTDLTNKQALEAVGLPHSSYYYKPKQAGDILKPLNPKLCLAIQEIIEHATVYGYRKVNAVLRANGWTVNHKRVLRYMRALKLLQSRKIKGCGFSRPAVMYPVSSNSYWEMDLSVLF